MAALLRASDLRCVLTLVLELLPGLVDLFLHIFDRLEVFHRLDVEF